jgi:hypothetical protein
MSRRAPRDASRRALRQNIESPIPAFRNTRVHLAQIAKPIAHIEQP